MPDKKFLIVIGGATATGKSALAMDLAIRYDTEIVSADSRQFYKEMNLGTAKPKPEDRALVPHHLVDFLSIRDPYSAGLFERDALDTIGRLLETRELVVLAGGSGLFLKAVCEGFDVFPPIQDEIVRELGRLHKEKGIEALQEKLQVLDPVYHGKVDLNNPRRLIRALAVCIGTGRPFSGFQRGSADVRCFVPVYIQLQLPREELHGVINRRVDAMIESGLVDEARRLYPLRGLPALQTVGYQELFLHFEGQLSLEAAVEKIKQNTRNYAKRQETWFRKSRQWKVFHPADLPGVASYIGERTGRPVPLSTRVF